jgi:hypothetical protein
MCTEGHRDGNKEACPVGKTLWNATFAATHSAAYRNLLQEAPLSVREKPLVFWKSLKVQLQWQGERCNRMILLLHRIAVEQGLWEVYCAEGNL